MDPILFDKFTKATIGFAVASDLSDVPEEPGVYAWYLPLRGDSSSDLLHLWWTPLSRPVMLQMEPEFSLLGYNVKPSMGVRNEEAT